MEQKFALKKFSLSKELKENKKSERKGGDTNEEFKIIYTCKELRENKSERKGGDTDEGFKIIYTCGGFGVYLDSW